jgi:aryl-alcohol dehydrogenase-like predicted oxidoreductase
MEDDMEQRRLGNSGLMVPVLTLGTGTFGGGNEFFKAWGATDVAEASRLIDICLEGGLSMFDTADVYSAGMAEEILGQAVKGRRERVLISTKATFQMGEGANEVGSSRHWLTRAVEASLRRLGTEYIDLFQLHGFDALTPQEEVMGTLDGLVKAGKIRYVGGSNFSGWHMMKALATSDRLGLVRHVAHQAYYSLIGRDYEWELMPLALDQGVGAVVWSPLGWGRLSGKYRRSNPMGPEARAVRTADSAPPVTEERFYAVMDALDAVAAETGKSVAQVALNWVVGRPSVATVIIGARNEAQLRDNLGAVGWRLSADQVAVLDAASDPGLPYPYWHQAGFRSRNPVAAGR